MKQFMILMLLASFSTAAFSQENSLGEHEPVCEAMNESRQDKTIRTESPETSVRTKTAGASNG